MPVAQPVALEPLRDEGGGALGHLAAPLDQGGEVDAVDLVELAPEAAPAVAPSAVEAPIGRQARVDKHLDVRPDGALAASALGGEAGDAGGADGSGGVAGDAVDQQRAGEAHGVAQPQRPRGVLQRAVQLGERGPALRDLGPRWELGSAVMGATRAG